MFEDQQRSTARQPVPPPSLRLGASPFDATESGGGWAEVRVRQRVMRYRRSGSGAPLLLLDGEYHERLWPELLPVLARRFRLILPEAPPEEADAAEWLADLLEGVGAREAVVVAAGRHCMPALELALRQDERVSRLVLVPDGVRMESESRGEVAVVERTVFVPLMVLRRDLPASEAIACLCRFLSESMVAAVDGSASGP